MPSALKPSVFIGSSSEGLDIAEHVQAGLRDVEVTLWTQGVFGLNQGNLDALVIATESFDYAILVLTPDDMLTSRDTASQSPRDNVLFECGLFMGRLGRDRTFLVHDKKYPIKLPTDLAGISLATFSSERSDSNLTAAVSEACHKVRLAIRQNGIRSIASISVPTGRLVYLLLYLEQQKRFVQFPELGQVLFRYIDPFQPLNATFDRIAWEKAARYAVYYLEASGLVNCANDGAGINARGSHYVALPELRTRFPDAFSQDLPTNESRVEERKQEMRRTAARFVYTAANETKLYLASLDRDEPRRFEAEAELSRLWTSAALETMAIPDFELAERFRLKGHYWADTERWKPEGIDESKLTVESVLADARQRLLS